MAEGVETRGDGSLGMGSVQVTEDSGREARGWGRRRMGVVGLVWAVAFAAPPVSAQEGELPVDYDAAIAQSGMDGSYGYVRTLEGSATLLQGDTGERVEVSVNEPLLAGDRLFASGESRTEILLADGNIVRVGDRAEVLFRALANSGDTNDPGSVIELARGTLQLVAAADQLGQEFPAVVTPNATVRARGAGSFLISTDDGRRTEVIVRDGVAEVTTANEVAEVRRGERLFVGGVRGERLDFAAAPDLDRLERWGFGLGDYQRGEYATHVDPDLHYAASSLRGHGSWVRVEAGVAWRPRVSVGWAPYRHGRWRHTPSGMFWVSHEPWGWVPYHYGYWDLHPSWGWVWFPGHRFAGAHVYWYWGPSYAGWIPSGYYWRHYPQLLRQRLGFPFRRLRTHRRQLRALPALDLPAARAAGAPAAALLLGERCRSGSRAPGHRARRAAHGHPLARAQCLAAAGRDAGHAAPRRAAGRALGGRRQRFHRPGDAPPAGHRTGRAAGTRWPVGGAAPAGSLDAGQLGDGERRATLPGHDPNHRESIAAAGAAGRAAGDPVVGGEHRSARAAARRPTVRDASSAIRRPARPVTRPSSRSASAGVQRRPASAGERLDRTIRGSPLRPETRRSGSTTARPTFRPFTTRPTARPTGAEVDSSRLARSSVHAETGGPANHAAHAAANDP